MRPILLQRQLYTLPSPIKLQPNGDVAYYIVYAPLVSKADGRDEL